MACTNSLATPIGSTDSVLRLLFGPLVESRSRVRLNELRAMSGNVTDAARLLDPTASFSNATSLEVARLEHEIAGWRRRLETRLARAGFQPMDPRLLSEAAVEMVQLVRLIARVVRCREWLRLGNPVQALELQATARHAVELVADSSLQLASTGVLTRSDDDAIKSRAEELYSQGIEQAFGRCTDPLDVLRHRTLCDGLLGVVLGSDSALVALRDASAD
jgi:hypothetical protein